MTRVYKSCLASTVTSSAAVLPAAQLLRLLTVTALDCDGVVRLRETTAYTAAGFGTCVTTDDDDADDDAI